MVLSTFILIQLGVCLVGLAVVYFLHSRRLGRETDLALEAWKQAAAELVAASGDEVHKAWLAERASEITGEGPTLAVRKLVLEHEQTEGRTLGKFLQQFLAPAGLRERWADLRTQMVVIINEILAVNPARARKAIQGFEHYSAMDQLLGFKPGTWPELPEGSDADDDSLAEENATLKAELNAMHAGTDDDLRKLIKQFTQDSREMMGCIQQLEKENQALKTELSRSQAA